jgi:hypothetical protein
MRTLTLLAIALAAPACSRPPAAPADEAPRPRGDSVHVPAPAPQAPDLVAAGALALSGGARYDTVTVGEAGLLRAETDVQLSAARRLIESGMYLGDPYRALRLVPSANVDAVAALGRNLGVGTPLSVELLIRASGPAPAPLLRFEHVSPGESGGRRVPSSIAFELLPAPDGGYDRARLLLGDGSSWSEQEAVSLPAGDWRQFAHRVGIVVARDIASIAVDGTAVIEQQVRIHGGESAPRLRAVAGATGGSVTVLQLTGLVEEEYIGAERDDDADDAPERDDERDDSDDFPGDDD